MVQHGMTLLFAMISNGKASPTFGHANANFSTFLAPKKESISEEMNSDNDLNLHLHDQISNWLRYCWFPVCVPALYFRTQSFQLFSTFFLFLPFLDSVHFPSRYLTSRQQ